MVAERREWTQVSLTWTAADQGRAVWSAELEWARRVVAALTIKEVAFALDVKATALSDMLAEREHGDGRRGLKAEHVAIIRQLASDTQRAEYLAITLPPLGYEPKRVQQLTPAEELALLKEHLRDESPGALRSFDTRLARHTVAGGGRQ